MLLEEKDSFGVAGSVILTWLVLVTTEASRMVSGLCFRIFWEQSCTREGSFVVGLVLMASSFPGKERMSVSKMIPHLSFNSDFKTA